MKRSNKTAKKKTGRSANRSSNGPGPNVVVYRGPTRLPEQVMPEIKTVELHIGGLVSSNASTIIDLNASSNGVRTLAADFSEWAGLYREYRVLSVRLEYHPNVINATVGTLVYAPVYTVIDRRDASAIAAYANVESNTSLEIFTLQQRWSRSAKMYSTGEGDFIATSADPAAYFSIKYFATGLTASSNFGRYLVRWVVQFRTRV